jgi:hypothetical protein
MTQCLVPSHPILASDRDGIWTLVCQGIAVYLFAKGAITKCQKLGVMA